MIRTGMVLLLSLIAAAPGAQDRRITLVVQDLLAPSLSQELKTWEEDLALEGTQVLRREFRGDQSPQALRELLIQDWKTHKIQGAFLVGNLPGAYFESPEGSPPFLVENYFTDLDAQWADADGDGWMDRHQGGKRGSEIYLGRLRADQLGIPEIPSLKAYFKRNHEYRRNPSPLGPGAINLAGSLQRAQRLEAVYPGKTRDYSGLSSQEFLDILGKEKAEVFHLLAHGNSQGFAFEKDKGFIRAPQLVQVPKNYRFYFLHSCALGDFTQALNPAGVFLLGNSQGLGVFTVTKEAGAHWFDHHFLADFLAVDQALGPSLKRFQEAFAEGDLTQGDEGEFILLGDPTLKFLPAAPTPAGTRWQDLNNDHAYSPGNPGTYASLYYANEQNRGAHRWGHYKKRSFGDYLDDVHASQTPGDYAVLTFRGSAVEILSETAPDHGALEILVDGVSQGTFSIQGPRKGSQKIFEKTWDTSTLHQVVIRGAQPGKWTVVDGFRIRW